MPMDSTTLRAWVLACALLASVAGCGGSGTSASPTQTYHQPTAVAGNAQTVFKQTTVTLDGSGSSDVDGHALTYSWTQTAGSPVVLSSSSSAKPTFTAPSTTGVLTFQLTVANAQDTSSTSSVSITVQNRAPVAATPASMNVSAASQVVLDGSGSSDPDQDPLTYAWTQASGPAVTLSSTTGVRPSFVAPSLAGTLVFSLTVSDGEATSAAATETIDVQAGQGAAPVASAGQDMTVPRRSSVTLLGSVLHWSGGPLTYSWQQTSGTAVTLQGANTAYPSFTAPATAGDLTFTLTVDDSGAASTPSSVTVHVQNYAPVVTGVALSPQNPRRADVISVSASTSDPDGDALTVTYAWTRNGVAVPQATGSSYPPGNQVKGDVIGVTVTASDGQLSTAVTATASIADTPAVLAGTAPTTAPYGVPLTFSITASDADGDPTGPLELEYGPAGFSVDTSGNVSWTPNGPLFDQSVPMNWGVRLKNAPSVEMHGTITVTDSNRKLPLVRTNIGIPINSNAIEIADFDGSGTQQVLVGTYHSVYLLTKSGSDYVQSWAYGYDLDDNAEIEAVASGDVDGDGHREIFFSAGSVLVKLDGVTRRETGRFGSPTATGATPTSPYCIGLKFADVDGDGKGELVCLGTPGQYGISSANTLYVLDPATMQVKWQSAALDLGTSLAVGNVDGDPDIEIVTSNGFVFDGRTGANKWAYGPGFGTNVDIGDVTGDGIGKIVAVAGGPVRVYDAVAKLPLFDIPAGVTGSGPLRVADIDGTAPAEIVTGDAAGTGNVYVYRYDSTAHAANLVGQINNSLGYGVSAIAVGDVNGDGQQEIVWGTDLGSSGRDYMLVGALTPSPAVLWSGPTAELDGAFHGGQLATIAPSTRALMFLTPGTDSGYDGARLIAMDPASGALSLSAQIDSNWSNNSGFDVADVYGTGTDTMLLGTANLYSSYFTAYDFSSNTKLWSSPTTTGGGVAVVHADLNGDGHPDLVAIGSDGTVYVWDVAHQSLIYSTPLGGAGIDIAVADLDGDNVPEIIALTSTQLIVLKASGSSYIQKASTATTGTALLVADTDGDGTPEIYVISGSIGGGLPGSTLTKFDTSLNVMASYTIPGAASLFLEQSAFGRKNLIIGTYNFFGNGGPSQLQVIDPSSGTLIWSSPPLLNNVPLHSLQFYDRQNTGVLQIAFGTGYGMYLTQ